MVILRHLQGFLSQVGGNDFCRPLKLPRDIAQVRSSHPDARRLHEQPSPKLRKTVSDRGGAFLSDKTGRVLVSLAQPSFVGI